MSKRRVVITGLGPVSPIGIGKSDFLNGLQSGKVGIGKITRFDPGGFNSQIAGEIQNFKCRDYLPKSYRKNVKVMARDIELAVACADQALRDAGLVTKGIDADNVTVNPTRFGVNIGAGLINADLNELSFALASAADDDGKFSLQKWGKLGMTNLTPLWLLKYLPNMLSCHVTIIHDAQGPSNAITCGEASGHLAVSEAAQTIARGTADICLCGGIESKLNPMSLMRQELMGRLTNSHNDTPEIAVRPFDAQRDGTAASEGGALLVLEELEHARSRGAKIYAEIVGAGSSFGTDDYLNPEPYGDGIYIAMQKALVDAGLSSTDMVIAFALGLKLHDKAEAQAINSVLEDIPVVSVKGQIGNSGAGSGALDVAASALVISEGFIPATTNYENRDPECEINVITETQSKKVESVISTSYSLAGGQTASLILKRIDN